MADHSEAASMSAEERRRVEEDRMAERREEASADHWRERFQTEQDLRLAAERRVKEAEDHWIRRTGQWSAEMRRKTKERFARQNAESELRELKARCQELEAGLRRAIGYSGNDAHVIYELRSLLTNQETESR